jgi:hypothetical protein
MNDFPPAIKDILPEAVRSGSEPTPHRNVLTTSQTPDMDKPDIIPL